MSKDKAQKENSCMPTGNVFRNESFSPGPWN
jgi:hypothetical protein